MSLVGREESSLRQVVTVETLQDVIAVIPQHTTLVVPTSSHAKLARRLWASLRGGERIPIVQTMAAFTRTLYYEASGTTLRVMEDAEADLLLDLAMRDRSEQFRPQGFSVDAIVRWKQELHTVESVTQMFVDADMPKRLDVFRRMLPLWAAYEARKQDVAIDRGDVSLAVIDALAAETESVQERTILVVQTHGLTTADKMILHLLSTRGCDVGIQFASYVDSKTMNETSRSLTTAMWLVGHGWTQSDRAKERNGEMATWRNGDVATLTLRTWPTKREEIRRALAAVKEWSAKGIAINDLCVVVPSSGSYDSDVITLAKYAGVPVSINEAQALQQHGAATTALAACNVVIRDWHRSDVERLVHSGYINHGTLPIGALPLLASKARINGGTGWNEWSERFSEEPELFSDGMTILNWLVGIIDPHSLTMTASRFGMWLRERVIYGLGIAAPEDLIASIDQYVNVADTHVQQSRHLSEHVASWWKVVASITLNDQSPRVNGVAVCKPHEVRGRRFSKVIVLGVYDGELPVHSSNTLDDELLVGLRESMNNEAMSDILQSCNSDGTIVLMSPAVVDGSETMPSIFTDGVRSDTVGIRALDDEYTQLLLDAADVGAYRSGSPLNGHERQRGLDADDLDEELQTALKRITERPLSPSRLDEAVVCPYQFYARRVLGMDEVSVDDNALLPTERGSLLHATVHQFFVRVRGFDVVNVTSLTDVNNALVNLTRRPFEELYRILVEEFNKQRQLHPSGHLYDTVERRMLEDVDGRKGILHRWLVTEIELQQNTEFRPLLFELDVEDTIDIGPRENERIKLRIDRVDAAIVNGEVHCVVIDYKSSIGNDLTIKAVTGGTKTQLLLYSRAIERYFERKGITAHAVGGSYHAFGRSVREVDAPVVKSHLPVKDVDVANERIDDALQTTAIYAGVIRSGRYPVKPTTESSCKKCKARELCRIDQWKAYNEQ